ncbi:hypothetical protein GCM10023149_15020 [Mucilaginibacter gynuensis]|uniref:Fibronectin type-III domain-containing protein n=1 Tax=Mucilaginibacter gynuensis TaxID=1302236 RepID=A0ABP8G4S8_9SPHI
MKTFTSRVIYMSVLCFALSCSKKDGVINQSSSGNNQPVKTTDSVTVAVDSVISVTATTASVYCKVIGKAGSANAERGLCWSLAANPTITDSTVKASLVQGNGGFLVNMLGLKHGSTYHVRGYVTNGGSVSYSKDIAFKTMMMPAPTVVTGTDLLAGATAVFVTGKITSADQIKESGMLISENLQPAVSDIKVTGDKADKSLFIRINDLKPNTTYYVRAFATNEMDVTGYGEVVKLTTIPKGNLTYYLNEDPNASPTVKENYTRIRAALDKAVYYYNNYTSIEKKLNVYYNPGIPTAEGSLSGYIGVGANVSYQRTGTILHEIAHTLGVGQHWMWWDVLIRNGVYQGKNGNAALKFLTRDPNAEIHGDGQHFWPFGVNGAFEDSGDEMLYIINVMLLQAMKEDGLPIN